MIKKSNIGETISLCMHLSQNHAATLYQWNNNHHIYCLKHAAEVQDGLYRVDAHVKIEGDVATGTARDRKKNCNKRM